MPDMFLTLLVKLFTRYLTYLRSTLVTHYYMYRQLFAFKKEEYVVYK